MGVDYLIGGPGAPWGFDTDGTLNQEYHSGALGDWTVFTGYSNAVTLGLATLSNPGSGYTAGEGATEITYTNVNCSLASGTALRLPRATVVVNGDGTINSVTVTDGGDLVANGANATGIVPGTGDMPSGGSGCVIVKTWNTLPYIKPESGGVRKTTANRAIRCVKPASKWAGATSAHACYMMRNIWFPPEGGMTDIGVQIELGSGGTGYNGGDAGTFTDVQFTGGALQGGGSGYDNGGTGTYENVDLSGGTGGTGAKATVRVESGVVVRVKLTAGGSGYITGPTTITAETGGMAAGGSGCVLASVVGTGGSAGVITSATFHGGYPACGDVTVGADGIITSVIVPSRLRVTDSVMTPGLGISQAGTGYTPGTYTGVTVLTEDDITQPGGRTAIVSAPKATVVVGAGGAVEQITITDGGDLGGGRGNGYNIVAGTGVISGTEDPMPSTVTIPCRFKAFNCCGQGYTEAPDGVAATGGGMAAGGSGCELWGLTRDCSNQCLADFWMKLNSDVLIPDGAVDPIAIQLMRFQSSPNRPRLELRTRTSTGSTHPYYQLRWSTSGTGGSDDQGDAPVFGPRNPEIISGQWTHIRVWTTGWALHGGDVSARVWVDGVPVRWTTGVGADKYLSAPAKCSTMPTEFYLGPLNSSNEAKESAFDMSFDDLIVASGNVDAFPALDTISEATPVQAMHTCAIVPKDRDCNEVAVTFNMQFPCVAANFIYGPNPALGHVLELDRSIEEGKHLTGVVNVAGWDNLYWQLSTSTTFYVEYLPAVADDYSTQVFNCPLAVTGDTKIAVIGDVQDYYWTGRTFNLLNARNEHSLFITTGDFCNYLDMGPTALDEEGGFGLYNNWDDLDERNLTEKRAFRLIRGMNQKALWFPNIGNHEMDGVLAPTGWDYYLSRVPQPDVNWALDWGHARIASIAPRYVTSPIAGDADDVDLEEFIRLQFSKELARTKWQVLLCHYPGYGNSHTVSSIQPLVQRAQLHAVLKDVGCHLMISGHIDCWNRYVTDGIVYQIVSTPSAEGDNNRMYNVKDGNQYPEAGSTAHSHNTTGGYMLLDVKEDTLDLITIGRKAGVPIDSYRINR